jgi:GntR family transcriptional repressor for pyruvate dehydrogenase complex
MLSSIPRQKIRHVIVERLKTYINSRGLVSGDRLPNETELAASFGVSRLSVREATKALEMLGIVESKTGVGLKVGRLDLERITGHLGFHTALQDGSSIEIIDTRIVVETGALPYAARRMAADPSVYDSLRLQADLFRDARDLNERIGLDICFHRTLLHASGLAPLVAFNEVLQLFFQKCRESVQRQEWQAGIDCHYRIINALRDQDVPLAIEELRGHIEFHKGRVEASM